MDFIYKKWFWIKIIVFTGIAVAMVLWGWEFIYDVIFGFDGFEEAAKLPLTAETEQILSTGNCPEGVNPCDPAVHKGVAFSSKKFAFSLFLHELIIIPGITIYEKIKNG